MANREIEAKLKISAVDRTGSVFKNVSNKMAAVNQRANQFNQRMAAVGQRADQYNRQMAASSRSQYAIAAATRVAMSGVAIGVAAGVAGVGYSVKSAMEFEDALFSIQKKSGATTDQMKKLRGEIRELGGELPVSIDEISSAFERGAAAGIPLDELKEFAKLAAGVADAWDSTSERVGNTFAGFTAGMGIQRKDLQAYASLINDLADSGIADETDIADFIDRAGASLKNFGMTPEQIAAYGAALLNLKMPAEVGARAMDTVTGKLLAPENLSPKSHKALEAIVGDMTKFQKLSGNAKLQYFLTKVEKLSGQKRASLLGALLGEGFDDEVMRLVSGLPELNRNLDLAAKHVANPSNSIMEAQTNGLKKFSSQLELLKNNLELIATDFGENKILPWLNEAMQKVNSMLSDMDAAKKATAGMSQAERDSEREWFVKNWKEMNPDAGWDSPIKALSAYTDANVLVGKGEFKSVYDVLAKQRSDARYLTGANKPSVGGRPTMPIILPEAPEFPGGDRHLKATDLPQHDVPVPGDRNALSRKHMKDLKEQYRQYNSGKIPGEAATIGDRVIQLGQRPGIRRANRQMLRNADPAQLGMDGMGGVEIENARREGDRKERLRNSSTSLEVIEKSDNLRNRRPAEAGVDLGSLLRIPSADEWRDALKIDVTGLKESGDDAGQKVADGGRQAGDAIKESAALVKVAGVDVAAAIASAAEKMVAAAQQMSSAVAASRNAASAGSTMGGMVRPPVNADTGRTPVSSDRPTGSGPS